ncbi:hypothetical protein LSH36_57g04077 [Paralvinella palmiformis]|uniref:FHA domain-containing protein n=1 Tax=Paralvinella palmiformis TaxID=53620 RepID=A0AAD9K6M9_9ANNE|nr:hypothetical protein LSH36_57g04077 [Paralvinella palmiformis]
MWFLRSKADPARCHALFCGRTYSIGRKDTDILLLDDMSISRKHAVLHVVHPEAHVMFCEKLPVLTVEDLSKFGTTVGEKHLTKEKATILSGDTIWFGNLNADNSRFVADYEPYLVLTSCLDPATKRLTRQLLCQLGGHIINECHKGCDALIMNNLSITIKAVCALICQKPIVTPKYLEDKLKALQAGTKQPNPEDYLPQLDESQLNPEDVTFTPNPQRQELFQGMHFIFLTRKQFKKMSEAITLGGGTPLLMEERTEANREDIFWSPKSRVMLCDLSSQLQQLTKNARNWVEHVLELLKKLYFCIESPGVTALTKTLSQTADVSQLSHSQTQSRDNKMSQVPKPNVVKVKIEPVSQTPMDIVPIFQTKQNTKKRCLILKLNYLWDNLIDFDAKIDDGASWSPTDFSGADEEQENASDEDMFASVPVQKGHSGRGSTSPSESAQKAFTHSAKTVSAEDKKINSQEIASRTSAKLIPRQDSVHLKSEFVSKLNIVIDDEFIDKNITAPQLVIEEKSLVVQKPDHSSSSIKVSGSCHGVRVKNFKTFRKVFHASVSTLPQIIGGSDLVASNHEKKEELEEWFKDYIQNGSQQESQPKKDDLDFVNCDPRRCITQKRKR